MKSATLRITKIPHGSLPYEIARVAGKYTCDVEIIVGTNVGNVKSPISFMSVLAKAKLPAKIEVRCSNWKDEVEALEEVCKYLR